MPAVLLKPRRLWLVLPAALIVVFPFLHEWPFFTLFLGEFRTFNATMFAVWLLILLGMNLLTGYSGQVSLGHAALVLISAYMTAVLSQQYEFPLWSAIVLSGAVTAVLGGVLIGLPAVRLRGPYLAIATFGLMLALPQILKLQALTRWTNGALGIQGGSTAPPGILAAVLDSRDWMYYVTVVAAVLPPRAPSLHGLGRLISGCWFLCKLLLRPTWNGKTSDWPGRGLLQREPVEGCATTSC